MDDYDLIKFTNYDIPNKVDLNMSIIKWGGEKYDDNFVFLDKLDTKHININKDLKLLEEVRNKEVDILNTVLLESSVIKVWVSKKDNNIVKISINYKGLEYILTHNV